MSAASIIAEVEGVGGQLVSAQTIRRTLYIIVLPRRKPLLKMCSCGSVVEHCVSSAKGCGFNSKVTHILIKK